MLIVTPIFISNIELKDNMIVFKGARIDDRITITEEKSNDGVTLQHLDYGFSQTNISKKYRV